MTWVQSRREEVQRDDVPQRREAPEVIVVGLHVAAGEDVEGRQLDEGGQRQGRGVRQQSGFENEQRRDEDVVEIVDDEVEHGAVHARRKFLDPRSAGQRAVDAVHDQRGEQPQHRLRPAMTLNRQHGQQCEHRAARGKEMNRPGGGAGGCGRCVHLSAANEKAFRSFRNSRFGGETAAAMRR